MHSFKNIYSDLKSDNEFENLKLSIFHFSILTFIIGLILSCFNKYWNLFRGYYLSYRLVPFILSSVTMFVFVIIFRKKKINSKLYEEIKHPYKSENFSYRIFIVTFSIIIYIIISLILIKISEFLLIYQSSYLILYKYLLGLLILFIISILFRKKI